jgi:hypothetical protein
MIASCLQMWYMSILKLMYDWLTARIDHGLHANQVTSMSYINLVSPSQLRRDPRFSCHLQLEPSMQISFDGSCQLKTTMNYV